MTQELILIDGHYHIYKSFFAFGARPLTNRDGDRVEAAYAITTLLWGLVKNRRENCLWAIAMDGSGPTFRHEAYEPYKATREAMPDELRQQFPWIETILEGFGIPILRQPGFEADDLIATLATRAAERGMTVTIQSKDKDLEQVLTDRIKLLREPRDKTLYGPEDLFAKRGIRPDQVVDYQALIGDTSDNIPGVKGVGPKTAVKVLEALDAQGAGLERLFQDPPPADVPAAALKKIRAHEDDLWMSRKLVELSRDAPVPEPDDSFSIGLPDPDALTELFQKLGFRKYLNEFPQLLGRGEPEHDDGPLFAQDHTPEPESFDIPRFTVAQGIDDVSAWISSHVVNEAQFAISTYPVEEDPLETTVQGVALASFKSDAPLLIIPRGDAPLLDFWLELSTRLRNTSSTSAPPRWVSHDLKHHLRALQRECVPVAPPQIGPTDPRLDPLLSAPFDTLLAAYLVHPVGTGYPLDSLVAEQLQRKIPAASTVEPGEVAARLRSVVELQPVLQEELTKLELDVVFRLEMDLIPVLASMEAEGISLDLERLQVQGRELTAEVVGLETRIYETAGVEFTIGSPKQLQEILFERLGLPPGKKTKTGYSTSAEVLEELSVSHPDQPLPALILEYRSLTKLLNTYITALPQLVRQPSGRLHTDLRQAVAATGRLASNKPNLQNIPVKTEVGRRVRRAFVPNHPKCLFLSADYSQIELRLLAHLSGDPELQRSMIAGTDIHQIVAARIHDKSPEDVTREERTAAKAVNFGVIYGMGAFGLARDLGISRTEAKRFIDAFFENFSQVKDFIDTTIANAHEQHEVRTLFGRRRPLPELTSRLQRDRRQGERYAVNTVVQGSAADLIKKAMIDVQRAIRQKGSPARMLLQIHDELLFEVPVDVLEPTEAIVRETMEQVLVLDVPLVVNVSSGEDWYDASK